MVPSNLRPLIGSSPPAGPSMATASSAHFPAVTIARSIAPAFTSPPTQAFALASNRLQQLLDDFLASTAALSPASTAALPSISADRSRSFDLRSFAPVRSQTSASTSKPHYVFRMWLFDYFLGPFV